MNRFTSSFSFADTFQCNFSHFVVSALSTKCHVVLLIKRDICLG